MTEQTEQAVSAEQTVLRKVTSYLKDCHPDGVTLEVDPAGISRGEFSWRVLVRPDREPLQLRQYYEALADVEVELQEREQLNVWLVTGDPKHPQSGREQYKVSNSSEPTTDPPGKRRQRMKKPTEAS
jgi:hypothetical protein